MSRAASGRAARAFLVVALVLAPPLRAQGVTLGGAVAVSTARVVRAGIAESELSGPILGAAGTVGLGRVTLEGSYLEGQLTPGAGTIGGRETMAEASVLLRARLAGGLSVGAGPRARAFIAPAGTVRWMRMEARLRYEAEVIPGRARADVEAWQVLSADVNAQGGSDGGRGGTAGLTLLLPGSRFALRLAYAADRVSFTNGASEFVDGLEVGLRIGRF